MTELMEKTFKEVLRKTEKYGQQHVFRFWDTLKDDGKQRLIGQVKHMDFEQLDALAELARRPEAAVRADDQLETAEIVSLQERKKKDAEAEKVYLYVDGNMDFEAADPTGDLTNNVPLAIGRHTGEFLVGVVDEAMVFRRALDEDEVNASMTPDTFMAVSAKDKLATTWGEIK